MVFTPSINFEKVSKFIKVDKILFNKIMKSCVFEKTDKSFEKINKVFSKTNKSFKIHVSYGGTHNVSLGDYMC